MFCPSCGQQQISSETKFCSRCGLPLGLIAEVLSYGGYLPQLAELGKPKKTFFTRRNGMGFALIWLIFFLFLTAIGGGLMGNEDFGAAMALIGFFGAAAIFLSSLIFFKAAPKTYQMTPGMMESQARFAHQPNHTALPPQQTAPAAFYTAPQPGHWRDTNDLQPTPVTESTTKLLDKDGN